MYNNDDTLFDARTKILIIELETGDDYSRCPGGERAIAAMGSFNAGTWTLDVSANSLVVCKRCRELIPVEGLKNISVKSLCDLIVGGYKKTIRECFLLAIKKGEAFDMEMPVVTVKDVRPKWLRIAGASARSNKDAAPVIHGMLEDISDRKNKEILKQDFLAMVSHDLRSPLSVIKLYVQLCGRVAAGAGNSHLSGMLEKANGHILKMDRMIQCYLGSSAISEGKLSFSPVLFDIKDLLCEVIGDLYLLNPGHIIFLKPGRGIKICADRDKIAQVVQNLLSNAIKYSSCTDVITVGFCTLGNFLQVVVEDHGIGIKAADQESVFNRFYRVEGENQRTVKGYGIGLYLSKEIIKKHNGDIWIESEADKGSRVYFTLPLT